MSMSPSAEFKPILSSSRSRVFQNGSLVIHSVVKSDEADYLCQVTNSVGSGLSKVIKLTVHIAAHFDTKFRAETVRKGQEARLKCEASGDRPLTIVWTKDKNKINFVTEPRYVSSITEPGYVSSVTEPRYFSSVTEPRYFSSVTEPRYVSSVTEPRY